MLKIYLALCGSPSDLASVKKIKSLKMLIKIQKKIEKIMNNENEIAIFFNIPPSLNFKKPYSFRFI